MAVKILITGRPGSGKTTLIRAALERVDVPAGGFFTQEVRDDRGVRLGFEIVTLDGQKSILAHVHIKGRQHVGKYTVDLEALEKLAVPAILEAVRARRLVVIDEIGPMELHSERFRRAVLETLEGDSPLLASIVLRSLPFADQVKARQGVTLLEIDPANREKRLEQAVELLLETVQGK